ncbi:D-serine ammonia-lyase [Dethiothermospora halolimnae]|uniref:D-serine ammonia-lyase n=1 Tax=Dethiothermospora halolimnae TaxID=3114390 RepID=UPI003CCB8155
MNLYNKNILSKVINLETVLWINEDKPNFNDISNTLALDYKDIEDASNRLDKFSPLIKKLFPETGDGIIESPLETGGILKQALENTYNLKINGDISVKCDSHLKVAGSIKARGGIYEVLKLAETIAIDEGLLDINDDYSKLAEPKFKELFSKYTVAVGSTGNLGLSIGIISSALAFNVDVHMSSDAKEWKKEKLRKRGVNVIEYDDDYTKAVAQGRKQCKNNKNCHFVDDENSKDLFLGYSVAALRLKKQLKEKEILVDEKHPLYVYLPCGVGGAPGGIAFGLKHVFGDNVHCYFVEPTEAPCMLLGLLTGKYDKSSIKDYGISGVTEADGLAVGSPSKLVSEIADKLLDGIYTTEDNELFKLLKILKDSENIKIEPSAASSLLGPNLIESNKNSHHICWLTGGLFLPDRLYEEMYRVGGR